MTLMMVFWNNAVEMIFFQNVRALSTTPVRNGIGIGGLGTERQ